MAVTSLHVSLPDGLKDYVKERVAEGDYSAPSDFVRDPIRAEEAWGNAEFLTAEGDLRTLPCHWPDENERMAGLDGFYAARIARIEGT